MIMQMLQHLWIWHRIKPEQTENKKSTKDKKTSFPKESIENADLMTTHE